MYIVMNDIYRDNTHIHSYGNKYLMTAYLQNY